LDSPARWKVYVAGPYSAGDVGANVHGAYAAANELADRGFAPYVPHSTHLWHLISPRPYGFWTGLDREFLPRCDAVLRIPGASAGADGEVALARALGIPLYGSIENLAAAARGLARARSASAPSAPAGGSARTARSVDSAQRIYAVLIALALSVAAQALYSARSTPWPAFVALAVTVVPFWQGMNRHLDRCYLEAEPVVRRGLLLLDVAVFLAEATFLFGAAERLSRGAGAFGYLGLLILLDSLWGLLSHRLHRRGQAFHALKWALINISALVAGVAVFHMAHQGIWLAPGLAAVAVLRTAVDYWLGWEFYFPPPGRPVAGEVAAASGGAP
jgi:hypothetical protein